jgi:hypothetical protein
MEPRGRWTEKVWEPLVYTVFSIQQTIFFLLLESSLPLRLFGSKCVGHKNDRSIFQGSS